LSTGPFFANLITSGVQLPTHTLTVINGTGSGNYTEGMRIRVSANPLEAGQRFEGWTRDWQILTNPFIPITTALMLSPDLTIEAAYSSGDKIRFYPRPGFTARMIGGVFEGTYGDPVTGSYTTIGSIITQQFEPWGFCISAQKGSIRSHRGFRPNFQPIPKGSRPTFDADGPLGLYGTRRRPFRVPLRVL
jgi:hypothetical protein